MARCARESCGRWRPDLLALRGVTGVPFNGAWFCCPECIAEATAQQLDAARRQAPAVASPHRWSRLGATMVHQHTLRADELPGLLASHRRAAEPLGKHLVRLGRASDEDVLRGLAAQAGISYLAHVDVAAVLQGPAGLTRDTVRALHVVPIVAHDAARVLHVACSAPVPRLALSALARLTNWRVEPFLVSDLLLPQLVAAYGAARTVPEPSYAIPGNVDQAAHHIATAVTKGGARRVSHARCDRHVWVRLEGTAGIEDFLLPAVHNEQEATCPVAHTSH